MNTMDYLAKKYLEKHPEDTVSIAGNKLIVMSDISFRMPYDDGGWYWETETNYYEYSKEQLKEILL